MDEHNRDSMNPLLAGLIGGVAGGLIVYLSNKRNRADINNRYEDVVQEIKDGADTLKSNLNKKVKSGKKVLAKKIRQVENKVAES